MNDIKLESTEAYKQIPKDIINIKTTLDVLDKELTLKNYKAVKAILTGLEFDDNNHHIFTISENSFEMISMLKQVITQQNTFKALWDWVYVYDTNEPNKYIPLTLPINTAFEFKKDIDNLKLNLENQIIKLLKSESYINEINKIEIQIAENKNILLNNLKEEAYTYDLVISQDENKQNSFAVSPKDKANNPLNVTEFKKLDQEKQDYLQEKANIITNKLNKLLQKSDIKKQKNIEKFTLKLLSKNIRRLINPLKSKWKNQPNILEYLNNIKNCVIYKFNLYINNYKTEDVDLFLGNILQVLIINSHNPKNIDAENPIIIGYENEPLFSTLEYSKNSKTNKIDIYKITPGLLHKANGGLLVLSAEQIITNKPLWESLKHILLTKKLPFSYKNEPTQEINKVFQPQPICLDIKIILIGDRTTYSNLKNQDKTFSYLFKIVSEFDPAISINSENVLNAAILIAKRVKETNCKHLTKNGLLKVLEIASIFAEKQNFITTEFSKVFAIIQEASLLAEKNDEQFITEIHIQDAFNSQKIRSNQFSLIDEINISNKSLLLDTQGTKVGQINVIYTSSFNGFTFGHPQRVTSVVSKNNKSEIIHVDIEVSLSGKIHSKAVMILEGYINSVFGKYKQLGFTASIAFEQSYGKINGDSASCAETIATLSALSNLPIKQGISITASMDQKGNIQPVGQLNAKIEGYFNICKQIGLDGTQGVIIPKTNVQNLMLSKEIRDAINENLFHIFPVEHINEIIKIIMDNKIGTTDKSNNFETGSLGNLITEKWAIKDIQNKS